MLSCAAHGRTKDNCQFIYEEDADGMPLRTTDDSPILRMNGIQTQSESYVNLLPEIPLLVADGVAICGCPKDLAQGGPEPKRSVTDGQIGRVRQAAAAMRSSAGWPDTSWKRPPGARPSRASG